MPSFPMVDSQLQDTAPFAMGVQSDSEGLVEYSLALAAAGTLDPTFDADGIVTTAIGPGADLPYSLALQPDGRIVVAGSSFNGTNDDFALARYNTDGSLDTTFSSDGMRTTAFGQGADIAHSLVLQPDGRIVVAGYYNYSGAARHFALARFNTNGSLDSTFDGDGRLTTAIGSDDMARSVVLQPDGKIVVAGWSIESFSSGNYIDFALARYNTDGSLDTTFDTDGKVTTAIGTGHSSATSLALQPDGRIVVAGYIRNETIADFALARYNTDGSLDTTFDTDGKVTTTIGADDSAYSIALQPDGKIVVAGLSSNGANDDFALARYNTDGSLDATFDTDGKVTTAIGPGDDGAASVVIQPDGRILVAGVSSNGTNLDFALLRYNTDGSLDTSFDGDGKRTVAVGGGIDGAAAVAIQSDGSIVAAGASDVSFVAGAYTSGDFALVRFLGDPPLNLVGGPGDDALNGGSANDTLSGLGGNDTLNGGGGADTAVYSGARSGYSIPGAAAGTVTGPDGADTVSGIERYEFSDRKLAFDLGLNQAAGNTVRVIGAAFDGPAISQHPDWVGLGLAFFDELHLSMEEVCGLVAQIMGMSNVDFVRTVYSHVVGTPGGDELAGLLLGSGGDLTQGQFLQLAASHSLNEANIDLVGLQASGVEFV